MALKLKFPSEEEQEFTGQVNELLKQHGARVTAYSVLHPDDTLCYHLTFECGAKRKSVSSDVPFHYDPPQAVVQRVLDWINGVHQAHRWSTEVPSDLE